ncbi:MAG: hypothetical protein P8X74_13465 [Reinekea sp.]
MFFKNRGFTPIFGKQKESMVCELRRDGVTDSGIYSLNIQLFIQ